MSLSISRASTAFTAVDSSLEDSYEKDKKALGLEVGNTIRSVSYSSSSDAPVVENDKAADRRLLRKIDIWVLPLISVLLGLTLDNRTAISFANESGMGQELKLNGNARYSRALVLFYVGYTVFGIPLTLLARKLRPRNILTLLIIAWGVVQIGVGYSANWQQLVGLRTLLGALEAAYFPICVYVLTSWYTRYELSPRFGFFFMTSVWAAGFGPILAYVFHEMHDIGGHPGWRWIYFMIGIIDVLAALVSYFFIPDFPDTATFLTEEERRQTLYRIEKDRGDSVPDTLTLKKVIKHLSSIEVWTLSIAYGAATVATNSFPYFIPLILRDMGYSGWKSSLLVAPPYIFTVFASIPIAWLTDKYRIRSPFILVYIAIGIVGFIIVNSDETSPGVKLFATFLCVAGSYSQIPLMVTLLQNNIVSDSKRAVVAGFASSWAGFGGITASFLYRHKDRPTYHWGHLGVMTCHGVSFILVLGTVLLFHYRNKKLEQAAEEANLSESEVAQLSTKEQAEFRWRYTL